MSLLRTARLLPQVWRSCARTVAVQHQQIRGYAVEGEAMSFTFASPAAVYYNHANVRQVDVPSMTGDFGILANHVPSLAVMRPGIVNVFEHDGSSKKYFVSSGSITINDDSSVQILAEEAVNLEDIDSAAVRDGLAKAHQEMSAAATEETKAQAQIAVECYEALQRSVGS